MKSKTFVSKTTSVVASIVLALGGSLVATQPATALSNLSAPTISGTATVGSTLTTTNGVWDTAANTVMYSWFRCNSSLTSRQRTDGPAGNPADCSQISNASASTYTLAQADYGKFVASLVSYSSASGSADWFSASTAQVSVASNPTCAINGVAQTSITSITSTKSNLTSSDSYHLDWNGDGTLNNCTLPLNANYGILFVLNGAQIGNAVFNANIATITMNSALTTYATLVARQQFTGITVQDGDILKIRYFFGGAQAPTVSDTPTHEITMTLYPGGVVTQGGSQQSTEQVTRSVERFVAQVPALQAPILNSLAPKLSSGFSSNGGRLVMKDVKPSDIASVTLNGKKVEVVASKSGSALRIPAGSGAGDLTFTMADGSVINVANAVKITPSQVDPKAVPLDSLPKFSGTSVVVPNSIKAALTKNAEIILDSVSAKCVGYASSNTAASRSVALSRASNVCGVITDINENIEPIVKVLVNKTVAKKSPVRYQTW